MATKDLLNTITCCDCLEGMKKLDDKSVDCVVTSPPYWALRDYGVKGQLGLEPTFQEYIDKLCNIFDEAHRVLKKTGTCWVVIGDTYGGSGAGAWQNKPNDAKSKEVYTLPYGKSSGSKMRGTPQDKCLLQIPSRFAIEMCNRGWILRNTIIWHKPNCMPSSVSDRFTVDFEYVFFFTKNKRYYFEQRFEPTIEPYSEQRAKRPETSKMKADYITGKAGNFTYNKLRPQGRNKRCVWNINTKPFSGAHFAVFPEALIEPMIEAGCPKDGIVLDPFIGSGTTAVVCKLTGRNYIGFEMSQDYCDIAEKRVKSTQGMKEGLVKWGK